MLLLALCSLQAQSQVSIVGPTEVRLGGDAQYSALLNGSTDSVVVWSVNGFIDGNTTTGPISASGRIHRRPQFGPGIGHSQR